MNNRDFLKLIITPNLDFEGGRADEKFCRFFANLYRIELYKTGLDLILTKLQQRQLRFEIRIAKDWDTNLGCYLRSENVVPDEENGKSFHRHCQKIVIRSFNYNVLAHELAHACEFNSKIDLGEDFRKAVALDMKDRRAGNIALDSEIQRLMIEALRAYKPNQFLSELFARYFELLSLSRFISPNGAFSGDEILDFFANVSNFIIKIFNPKIFNLIDPEISKATASIVQEVKISESAYQFRDQVNSRDQKFGDSWSKGIKSNFSWFNNLQNTKRVANKSDQ